MIDNKKRSSTHRRALCCAVALALGSGLMFGPADAGDGSAVPLSSLDGDNGFRVDGGAAYDLAGLALAGAGDMNGDGIDDFVVSSYGADPNGDYSGRTYVVFGSATGFPATQALDALDGSNGFQVDGLATFDRSGRAVAGGDLNGDGLGDLVIGANSADPASRTDAGSTYVVFGQAGAFPAALDLATLDGDNGFRIDGAAAYEHSGASLSANGDINGDGIDDLVLGAYGATFNGPYSGSAYVVFGHVAPFPATLDLGSLDGSSGVRLDGSGSAGRAVSSADINGDGADDVLVGAPSSSAGANYAGSTYVVFGQSAAFPPAIDMNTLDGDTGFRIDGDAAYTQGASALAGIGDINGDGFEDFAVGAGQSSAGVPYAGSTWVVFGTDAGFDASFSVGALDGNNGFRIDGVAPYDRSGGAVAAAGDFNGDGMSDLLIGAAGADPNGDGSGSSYVVFGSGAGFAATLSLSALDGTNGLRFDGVASGDSSGNAVARAGDINGDGAIDILIGAPNASPNGMLSGSAFVVFAAPGAAADVVFCDGFDGGSCASP
jgi:hypothetical protein